MLIHFKLIFCLFTFSGAGASNWAQLDDYGIWHPPLVVSIDGTRISSDDLDPYWANIDYRCKLSMELNEAYLQFQPLPATAQMVLNGRPFGSEFEIPSATHPVSLAIPGPGLGNHEFQIRYWDNSLQCWGEASPSVHFNVVAPGSPQIIAVSNQGAWVEPIGKDSISVGDGKLHLKLANVNPDDRIVAYLDGKPVGDPEPVDLSCCVGFDLTGAQPVGFYSLELRKFASIGKICPCKGQCRLASQFSDPVLVHFYNSTNGSIDCNSFVLTNQSQKTGGSCRCPKINVGKCDSDSCNEDRCDHGGCSCSSSDCGKSKCAGSLNKSCVFSPPAHFPIREFDSLGGAIDNEGLVIYEDMEFRYNKNGDYQISFRVGTPEMPSKLRLQFQYKTCQKGQWHTISIPPICFDEVPDCDLGCKPVKISGHSATLAILLKKEQGDELVALRRTGTAQFGYGAKGLSQSSNDDLISQIYSQ